MKRLFDFTCAALGLILLVPLMIGIALAVRISLGSPVIFRQSRAGLGGAHFTLYKFRTMHLAQDSTGANRPDAKRLNGFGRLLRATSLDELPELWNVLRGDMSLVGPRPLLTEYLPLYSEEQARRHTARPGLTGWAQVNGRNAVSWPERFAYDIWYVDHQTLVLDFKIILKTVKEVLTRQGINHDGHATMEKFRGNSNA